LLSHRRCLDGQGVTDGDEAGTAISSARTTAVTDGWTTDPTAVGVVLVGDAAGWSDPTAGQGLPVSMRDVRVVSEQLLANSTWDRTTFERYRRAG
jgi:2-polyprenyl-6-methoxyphenol hydroxylase-like FAD-dependent oxidoreductase